MVLLYERCVIAIPAAVASHFQHQYRSRMLFCQLGHFLIDEEALVLVIGLDGSLHNVDLFGCRARYARNCRWSYPSVFEVRQDTTDSWHRRRRRRSRSRLDRDRLLRSCCRPSKLSPSTLFRCSDRLRLNALFGLIVSRVRHSLSIDRFSMLSWLRRIPPVRCGQAAAQAARRSVSEDSS